ncbi:MAG: UPF0175 family protein [Pyrinomonadaceae bacterium]
MVNLPDTVAGQIAASEKALERSLLEALALEEYRCGRVSAFQVGQMLGFEHPTEVDAFLTEHRMFDEYSKEEIAEQRILVGEVLPLSK